METGGFPVETAQSLLGARYRTHSVIGRGGTAAVYRATDEALGRDVAIKLFPAHAADAEEIHRQHAEIRVAATLNHPGLVTLYDAGTDLRTPDEPRMFLVMELVQGRDLRRRLQRGPLSSSEAARTGRDVATALHYIHSRGVLHRDIKPANILLTEGADAAGAHAKLTDFGIARLIEGSRLTATGATVGTAAYLSPEQARGQVLGPASDVYSLGLVLLECLTGRTEYPGTAVEAAVARLHRPPLIPAGLGPAWVPLLRRMTATDPAGRPSAQEAADLLADALVIDALDASHGTAGEAQGSRSAGPQPVAPPESDVTRPITAATVALAAAAEPHSETAITAGFPTARPLPARPARPPGSARTSPDGSTAALATTPDATAGRRRPGRRSVWLAAVALSVLALAVIAFLWLGAATPATAPPPPSYPSVPGQLGTHLQQLEKSVRP